MFTLLYSYPKSNMAAECSQSLTHQGSLGLKVFALALIRTITHRSLVFGSRVPNSLMRSLMLNRRRRSTENKPERFLMICSLLYT